ncbi:tyrosine-type recombinase/integrase [Azospirillum halopraeferens]|uniref:tyrosine-type recombinase/integrase n=1 Tax=Azospirillum halopraeferens TaxID=34010 RepID=UPI000A05191D|nr:tyrosine-type recombinase/integrase [Azospirillum halopraeferens]
MSRKQTGRRLVQHGQWYIITKENSRNFYRARIDPETGREQRFSLGTADLCDAEQKLVEWLAAQYSPVQESPAQVPLAWVLVHYFEEHASKIRSAEQARIELRYWTEWWGQSTVSDITLKKQEQFILWLQEGGKSNGYISRILSTGRAALKFAWKHGCIQAVPFVKDIETAEEKRSKEPKGRPLLMAEVAALLDAVEVDHLWRFCVIMINTMCRPEAALELTSTMIDHYQDYVNLLPPGRKQTRKRRPIVPLTDTLRWHAEQWGEGPLVAVHGRPIAEIDSAWRGLRARVWPPSVAELAAWDAGHVDLRAKNPRAFRRARAMVCGAAGRKVTPYSFRHTLGRELRRRRVPVDEISVVLGHKQVSENDITGIYCPHDPDYCINAERAIDAYCQEVDRLMKCRRLVDLSASLPAVHVGEG